jgi:DNA modification methylase
MLYGKIAKGKHLGQDYILCNTLNFTKGIEREHPCPKPLDLIRFLIDKFSNASEIVLDPFVGSGTTAVAAKMEGRNYVGIEISEKYCEIARRRVASAPTPLFAREKIAA